ncbi:MAG: NAD(P)/FAD-dependent oxidoreductase [Planctomycetes bacterium]|nr:NAD(P)/FAD-dependent oxidoreductase [Planctomycetota bacterium]
MTRPEGVAAPPTRPRVVIVGGGFGGLYAAKRLGSEPVDVTLVDRRNFHLFQPLLYQTATGMLSVGDIASPLRGILRRHDNVRVLQAEVVDLDVEGRRVLLRDGEIPYDILVLATGSSHHYFGREDWAAAAPGLKTVEDSLRIRRRILVAFEEAERETDPAALHAALTFVVIGSGPTGVEMAGALGELAHATLKRDFRAIDPTSATILLVEAADRILPTLPPQLSEKAARSLARLGVAIRVRTRVIDVRDGVVTLRAGDADEVVRARTILWTAGVKASPLGAILARRTGATLDRGGRVVVGPDLTVPGHAEGTGGSDKPLPGVAPVAMQQGRYVADCILARRRGEAPPPFCYRDKGTMVVIGRNAAVAEIAGWRLSGFAAWIVWVFVHIAYLIEFENKILVLVQWAWNYFTRKRGTRLITGDDPPPEVKA